MRSGQQLLDAAEDDARISIALLSHGGAASAAPVHRLVEALHSHLASYIRTAGPVRPNATLDNMATALPRCRHSPDSISPRNPPNTGTNFAAVTRDIEAERYQPRLQVCALDERVANARNLDSFRAVAAAGPMPAGAVSGQAVPVRGVHSRAGHAGGSAEGDCSWCWAEGPSAVDPFHDDWAFWDCREAREDRYARVPAD